MRSTRTNRATVGGNVHCHRAALAHKNKTTQQVMKSSRLREGVATCDRFSGTRTSFRFRSEGRTYGLLRPGAFHPANESR